MRLGVSSSSCTMSRPCLSVKPPDICVLRLPGGVAGRLKAGDWSESADGASSGHAAARSGSGCEPLSILVPGSTCRSSGDERSRCSAPGPRRAPGRQGTEAHPPGDARAHAGCWEGARGSARQASELRRRHLPAHGGLQNAERQTRKPRTALISRCRPRSGNRHRFARTATCELIRSRAPSSRSIPCDILGVIIDHHAELRVLRSSMVVRWSAPPRPAWHPRRRVIAPCRT